MSQPFPSSSISTPKIPPEVVTIGSFAFGVLLTLLTATGVTPANANAIVAALQFVVYAVFAVVGTIGQIHVHTQHIKAKTALAVLVKATVTAPLVPPAPSGDAT